MEASWMGAWAEALQHPTVIFVGNKGQAFSDIICNSPSIMDDSSLSQYGVFNHSVPI